MPQAILKINGEDFPLEHEVTTIGRASDNHIALAGDSNISRYHAEIEKRAGEFWLIDLGSSNGTKLNDETVTGEIVLHDGDFIVLGGTSEIEFFAAVDETAPPEEKPAAPAEPVAAKKNAAPPAVPEKSSSRFLLPGIAVVVGLFAIIAVGAAIMFATGFGGFGAKKCAASAKITSPENGETITKETPISVSAEKTECVSRAVFLLDENEIGTSEAEPYSFTVNPKNFPELADGAYHSLKLVLEDANGEKIPASEVVLTFETAEIAVPKKTPDEEETPVPDVTPPPTEKRASIIETREMSKRVLKQFSGNFNYKFDERFLGEVSKKTAEFAAAEGFSARAEAYRDLINLEFHKENGLDAPLGFLLAMSRSKFNPQKQGADEGLWQLSDEFVTSNSYKAACPTESLSDKSQICAAKTAALYTKKLILTIFEGDVVYAVAAFGMSEQEAGAWAASLPAAREDFWNVIKNQKAREQVVKFFAAATVAENPQSFGLKKDRRLSDLYRNLMVSGLVP